jgi:hypothetical protein
LRGVLVAGKQGDDYVQSSAWAALLRHIPGNVQHNLMLVTRSGTEMCIQAILRVDHEFLAFKGRLAGSQDAGRLFFVAFDQIDYLGFQQPVREEEFHELFDGLRLPAPATALPPVEFVPAAEPEPQPEPAIAQTPAAAPGGPAAPVAPSAVAGASAPIKSAVLERFRSRQPSSGVRPPVKR